MKFFLEEFRAAGGVPQILRGVAARSNLHADCAALEGGG